MTVDVDQKPDCRYTATLIARDRFKDIALLQIQDRDIFGAVVSYQDFPVMNIDYDFVPKGQDEIIAIGYPRIGSETISETK